MPLLISDLPARVVCAAFTFLCAVSGLLVPAHANAQSLEGGLAIGLSAYDGELSRIDRLDKIGSSRFAFGLHVRATFNDALAARLYYHRSELHGADSLEAARSSRNLSFRTDVDEIGVLAEVYPLRGKYMLDPYLFTGVAGYAFRPETQYRGRTVALQPLGTEGQGRPGYDEPYSLQRLAVPVGAGIRLQMGPKLWLSAELGARLTFFDYLDDVSGTYADPSDLGVDNDPLAVALADRRVELGEAPARPGSRRGSAGTNDYYVVASFSLSYRFRENVPAKNRGKTACYKF